MTRYTPQWLQSGSYAASQDRRLIGALWPGPASTGCAVTAASGMTVNVAAGQVAVPSQNNTGATLCSSDGVEAVGPLSAAPGSGTNRIDLIICRPRGTDLDGGGNNDFLFDFVTGTAAATPTAPATPAGTVALAQIYITGGSASISGANITDVRPGGLAAGAGGLPPPVTSGTTVQTFTDSSGEVWVAKNGVAGGGWRRARDAVFARVYRAGAWSQSNNAVVPFDTITSDAYGMFNPGPSTIVVPVPGAYLVSSQVSMTSAAANNFAITILRRNAQQWLIGGPTFAAAASQVIGGPAVDLMSGCAAGDVIDVTAQAPAALAGSAASNRTFLTVQYLHP